VLSEVNMIYISGAAQPGKGGRENRTPLTKK